MDIFSALLIICEGNPSVIGGFPSQRSVTRNFGIFFYLCLKNSCTNNWDTDDLRCHRAHFDVIVVYQSVMLIISFTLLIPCLPLAPTFPYTFSPSGFHDSISPEISPHVKYLSQFSIEINVCTVAACAYSDFPLPFISYVSLLYLCWMNIPWVRIFYIRANQK